MGNDDFDASLARLRLLSRQDLDTYKSLKDLDASGRDELYAILQRSIHLDTFTELDVQLFAMSALFNERYDVDPNAGHPGLAAINTEYDPPKMEPMSSSMGCPSTTSLKLRRSAR